MATVAAVIYRLTILSHNNLAARIGFLSDSGESDGVDGTEAGDIHTGCFECIVAGILGTRYGLERKPFAVAASRDRQNAFERSVAIEGRGYSFDNFLHILIGHHDGRRSDGAVGGKRLQDVGRAINDQH